MELNGKRFGQPIASIWEWEGAGLTCVPWYLNALLHHVKKLAYESGKAQGDAEILYAVGERVAEGVELLRLEDGG